ncbi:unnamed protein product [Soboliphyme baturini]|uniref:PCRF domain-containing protein n=1 Tax=Soboliphyme baturini TaxID=241478 RepID=A0A183IME8_9BILA|nr:unnamed protein product [Soboliphyme baturini]
MSWTSLSTYIKYNLRNLVAHVAKRCCCTTTSLKDPAVRGFVEKVCANSSTGLAVDPPVVCKIRLWFEQFLANEQSLVELETFAAETSILDELLREKSVDNSDALILEISCGVGGQEAMLFAGELFNMYQKYCFSKNWTFELLEVGESDLGKTSCCKFIIMS